VAPLTDKRLTEDGRLTALDTWQAISVDLYREARTAAAPAPRALYVTGPTVRGPYTVADLRARPAPAERILVLDRRPGLMGRDQAPCLYDLGADFASQCLADGGTFAYSCDSRFAALNHGYPIPIHDFAMG
jgi:hypothetical protein